MKNIIAPVLFYFAFAILGINFLNAQKVIHVQNINKLQLPDNKGAMFIAEFPFFVKETDKKNMMFSIRFDADREKGILKGIFGIEVFAKGLGKCFFRDSLNLVLANGRTVKLRSTSPEFCEQPLSCWFELKKPYQDTLFSSPVQQVHFKNGKTGETFIQEITEEDEQNYFIVLKKIFDKMVPPVKPPVKVKATRPTH